LDLNLRKNCVRSEVLWRVKEERNILHTIKRRKVNWIGHILRRNCPLKQWYSTFFVRVPPHIISLQLCTPKVVGA
jgi:hypothetical protein